jgi:hypothetical protein
MQEFDNYYFELYVEANYYARYDTLEELQEAVNRVKKERSNQ